MDLNDDLQIYRGKDFIINDKIKIHQPTLDEICEFGEQKYFGMVYNITAVGADMKWQLWDAGIDYTKISDFELFFSYLCTRYPKEYTSLILGDLDFSYFSLYQRPDESYYIYDKKNDILIDEFTYMMMIEYIRKMHNLKRNNQIPANNSTKMALIEDDREDYFRNKDKEYTSVLKPLISTMINMEGFNYTHETIWGLKISVFLDSVNRISTIKNADILLQSGYSGYGINLKDIDDKKINWFREL